MLDILIPLYKNENYIKDCINSIKNQTFEDYTVYILDDGSPDNSFSIAQDIINNDPRFILKTRPNKGVSITRQELIDMSSQSLIMFIDSDDYLYENTTLEKMINKMQEENSDIIISTIIKKIDNKIIMNRPADETVTTVNQEQALKDLFYIKYNGPSLIASIFKREQFENEKFKAGIIYEDADLVYRLMLHANRITYYNIISYVYVIKNDSIMRTAFSEKNMVLLDISRNIVEEINKKYPHLKQAAIYSLVNNALELLRLKVLSNGKYDDQKQIIKEIRKYKKNILDNPNSRRGKIIQVRVASLGEFWFKILMIIYVRVLHKF